MSMAFVLGNGLSRQGIDLQRLVKLGSVYGCNALYREFEPTVLVATDRPIAEQIQHSGYAQNHRFYTRKPIEGLGALRLPDVCWGYSSGPAALSLAAQHHHAHVYLLGFDMGPTANGRFNNVYADTEFYKASAANPTFTGNWIQQITQVINCWRTVNFYRVKGPTTADIAALQCLTNLAHLDMKEFLALINI